MKELKQAINERMSELRPNAPRHEVAANINEVIDMYAASMQPERTLYIDSQNNLSQPQIDAIGRLLRINVKVLPEGIFEAVKGGVLWPPQQG